MDVEGAVWCWPIIKFNVVQQKAEDFKMAQPYSLVEGSVASLVLIPHHLSTTGFVQGVALSLHPAWVDCQQQGAVTISIWTPCCCCWRFCLWRRWHDNCFKFSPWVRCRNIQIIINPHHDVLRQYMVHIKLPCCISPIAMRQCSF